MSNSHSIALKVDCDTFEGTRKGVPTLLRIFDQAGIKATFFFTLGPDRSGRAIRRIFTQKGFLMKMLRSKAVSLYGPKTMLYGTLLPAPMIGKELDSVIKSVEREGHEVGVHGWDHVWWHDYLSDLEEEDIRRDYALAHQMFESIFGFKARSSAAPGWHATATSLAIQESFNLIYASDTRGGTPFFPKTGDRIFKALEIPTTLPTWDESLADRTLKNETDLISFYVKLIRRAEVHTLHTEVEGMSYANLFVRQLDAWKAEGYSFETLSDLAGRTLRDRSLVPTREIRRISLPNRGGLVSSYAL